MTTPTTCHVVTIEGEEPPDVYWTPERRAAAIPDDLLPVPSGAETARAAPAGAEVVIPGAPPDGVPELMQTFAVPSPIAYPYTTVGRLFYTRGGQNRAGSAAVVANNGILTAAHCVYDAATRLWSGNMSFWPAYDGLTAPYGLWPVTRVCVPQAYVDGTLAWDFAFGQLGPGSVTGGPVAPVVGSLGLVVNRDPRHDTWTTAGYPGVPLPNYPFDGHTMWGCTGAYTRTVDLFLVGKEGNLTEGSSGGPWLLHGGGWVAAGVQSHRNNAFADENYSPYFDTSVLDVYHTTFG